MSNSFIDPNWSKPQESGGAESCTCAQSIFDNLAQQIEELVIELNRLRGAGNLYCERTRNRIAVYRRSNPQVSVDLEFDAVSGIVRLKRQQMEDTSFGRVGTVLADLRWKVDVASQRYIARADYCHLARKVLGPLVDAFN